jgi:hypothetical protein
MDYTTVIAIQVELQRLTLKEIDRAKLIQYMARNKINADTWHLSLLQQSLVAERDMISDLIKQDIWEVVLWK